MSNVSDHIDKSLNRIRVIFEKAAKRIEELKPGEKIPATKLAEQLAEEDGLTGPSLYPTLKFLFDNYPGVIVKRGATGGIIRPAPEPPKVEEKKEG